MTIFSRMHSRWAGLKLGYFNRATNSIGTLSICWLYMRQKYVRGRRRYDRGRCKTPSPARGTRRKPPKHRESPSPTRGGAAAAKGGNGGLGDRGGGDVWTDRGWRFRQPWREAGAGNAGAGMRARECVLCDEYAYIRAKRGRRRIGFAGSAGRNPTGARERRIFRGDALLAGEAWPAASPFGAPDRAHMYMWRFLATACAGSEPSVSVHVAKARIESR